MRIARTASPSSRAPAVESVTVQMRSGGGQGCWLKTLAGALGSARITCAAASRRTHEALASAPTNRFSGSLQETSR